MLPEISGRGTPVIAHLTPWHTAITQTYQDAEKVPGALTHIVLYSEVLLSQNTRPEALLSLKFPQPKLPVKTLLGREKKAGS